MSMSTILVIEFLVVIAFLFLISAFSSHVDSIIESGNFANNIKYGRWTDNTHSINKHQIHISYHNNIPKFYIHSKVYQLHAHINHKVVKQYHLNNLNKKDRVFMFTSNHKRHLLVQTKGSKNETNQRI